MEVLLVSETLVHWVGLKVGECGREAEVETEMVLVPREVPLGAFSVCVGEASEPLGEGELVKQPLLDMFKEAVKIGVADVLGELVTLVQYVGLWVGSKLVGELVVETVEVVVLLGVPLGSLGVDVGEADPLGVVEEVTLGLFTGVTLGTTVLVDV